MCPTAAGQRCCDRDRLRVTITRVIKMAVQSECLIGAHGNAQQELRPYNWGDSIAPGEGSPDE
jgi:hypothetical protein